MTDMQDAALARALEFAGQGGLATDFTRISGARAADLCKSLYGIVGAFERLETEKDDTYRITTPGGRFILKIANPEEAEGELDLQLSVLKYLEDAGVPVPVPRVVPACDGASLSRDPETGRMVRLLSYVEGTPLDHLPLDDGQRFRLGRVLGQLRLALAGFSHPAQGRQLVWDVQHALLLRPLLAQVPLPAKQAGLANDAFDRLEDLAPRIEALPRQVLHNDFYASNIVADLGAPYFVTGVIDFGDVVETAVAIDVSTALAGQILRKFALEEDIFAPARSLLAGYLAEAPLSEEELSMIPHLVMARVLLRAVMTRWRAAIMPANATYILRNAGPSWDQLAWFLARPVLEVETLLHADMTPIRISK